MIVSVRAILEDRRSVAASVICPKRTWYAPNHLTKRYVANQRTQTNKTDLANHDAPFETIPSKQIDTLHIF